MADRGSQVQEIKEATDIVDLVSQYTALTPAGKRMKGLSPFTNEKTPSFFVDPDAGVYYCFSSQKGGDVFTFVQETEGVDFREALKMLADRAGIDLRSGSGQSGNVQVYERLYHVLESVANVYQRNLNREVLQYLYSRGISKEFVASWGIGYAPDAWNTVCTKQMSGLDDHIKAGMCVRKESSVYDRFRNRVQFPFYDERGRVVGFSGRIYGSGEGAKYINSPESPLFHKSSFLYGLHKAKPHIRKHNVAMLTEGPVDAIMMHQAGYPMTVATSGTAVTKEHLAKLKRLSNRLLVVPDGDAAGMRAALRVVEMAFGLGMDSKVVVLPDGDDPADVIKSDISLFKKRVKEAFSATRFLTHYVACEYGEAGEDRVRGVREVVMPVIGGIQDPLVREYAVRDVADFCGLSVETIQESLTQTLVTAGGQETFPAPRRVVASIEKKGVPDEKVRDLLRVFALSLTFLQSVGTDLTPKGKELFLQVQSEGPLPEIDKNVATLRYEELFADEKDRVRVAQAEADHTLDLLCSEIRKRSALKKSREAEVQSGSMDGV